MQLIGIEINKSFVWGEVEKNSEYVGSKLISEVDLYDSLRITEDDESTLERLFTNALAAICGSLAEMYRGTDVNDDGYVLKLSVAEAWDPKQKKHVDDLLLASLVNAITGKWLMYSNKDEATKYSDLSQAQLTKALGLLYSRRRPKPPVNN